MQLYYMTLLILIALGIGGVTSSVSAQPSSSVPGTANPNDAVGPQGVSPPVSGNFGVTQSPGTTVTPGYSPGAQPPGVGSGAGPGLSSGAPFSGTGYGTNSLGRTSPDAGASVPSTPSIGTQGGAMGPGGRSTNRSSLGSGPGAGAPGPSMGSTPSSGAMAPGAGAGAAGGR